MYFLNNSEGGAVESSGLQVVLGRHRKRSMTVEEEPRPANLSASGYDDVRTLSRETHSETTVHRVASLGVSLVGEEAMRMGCGHNADRFAMELFAGRTGSKVGPNSLGAT